MKNKNLILGIFILGIVLMSSFAIAGITGYVLKLQRGETVTDDNLGTTTVTDVSRGGVATIKVTNPQTGTAETLFGRPGETLTTSSGTQFTVQSAESGGLFRRGRTEISVVKKASGSGSVTPTGHTHLTDYKYIRKKLDAVYYVNSPLGAGIPQNAFSGIINCVDEMGLQEVIALSGGYQLTWWDNFTGKGEVITQENGQVYGEKAYGVSISDLRADDLAYVDMVTLCARVEPTLHQFSLDY